MRPLDGITVIEFSRVLAGPFATQILADLGADVIKIERPGGGDESRSFEPRLPGGESAYFFAFNRGKRSVTLNLRTTRGQEVARGLAAGADVLVENFMPGTMDKYGLGYEALATLNPGLVYISSTGFGQSGPYADRKGYDTVFQALSGIMSLTGHPDTPPAKVGIPVSDMTSGLWIVISALTGLLERNNSGRGGHVDLAMMDVQASLLALAAARIFALDEDPGRTGTAHLGRVPSSAFECADGGWLHISASDQHWKPLCEVLGLDELAADPALAANEGRLAQRERVTTALAEAVARRPRDELATALRAVDVPAGEVKTAREALADPHTVARGMVGHFDHPTEGRFSALRTPLRLDETEYPEPGVPPLLGADTEDVLTERLGLDRDELARLREEGTI
ncbi:crotonobetainyl-CoA:carnitine CoA-transferase CaiB-like acyl-CoA transferase [Actinomadura pelletieri DSM 43383]|uniref:Crotonobetainyl-CoA:carnitine CoA-transferase CaiB-like acyl-CoA transferase n=1 Tax=Actinomadura pelletieri DSM 43383 TaxID=1120940 RepID=A0A495QTV8_9ACTN|nr:CaiB/BaiF CoA-transferase family protein [Actinomadura pelletieri]RKS76946.1 crotonobetainyl-CoA:carnitine CoA-transferase CaiB-like acyl-CoA transferase [Actinomadura pelletieri DSM 43383]